MGVAQGTALWADSLRSRDRCCVGDLLPDRQARRPSGYGIVPRRERSVTTVQGCLSRSRSSRRIPRRAVSTIRFCRKLTPQCVRNRGAAQRTHIAFREFVISTQAGIAGDHDFLLFLLHSTFNGTVTEPIRPVRLSRITIRTVYWPVARSSAPRQPRPFSRILASTSGVG